MHLTWGDACACVRIAVTSGASSWAGRGRYHGPRVQRSVWIANVRTVVVGEAVVVAVRSVLQAVRGARLKGRNSRNGPAPESVLCHSAPRPRDIPDVCDGQAVATIVVTQAAIQL